MVGLIPRSPTPVYFYQTQERTGWCRTDGDEEGRNTWTCYFMVLPPLNLHERETDQVWSLPKHVELKLLVTLLVRVWYVPSKI